VGCAVVRLADYMATALSGRIAQIFCDGRLARFVMVAYPGYQGIHPREPQLIKRQWRALALIDFAHRYLLYFRPGQRAPTKHSAEW
jgi:hypothetical protein